MRLGYSCHDSFPSADTNTQQIFWTVFEVTRFGAAVDLVVPAVHADGADPVSAVALHYGAPPGEIPSGFALLPVGAADAAGWLAKGWFDWRVSRVLARGRYDLVWTRDALAAVSCARGRLPFVFETYRPDFAAAPAFALWRRACLASGWCRGIVTHSRVAADAFTAAGVPAARVLVAHNGYAPALMLPRLDRGAARARLGLPADSPLVVYAGHVGREKGIDTLLRMMAAAPRASLLILGVDEHSDEAAWVMDEAGRAGAASVILRPRVRVPEVAPYLYAADCLVIPPTAAPLRRYGRTVLPMKIFSYLAAGRPVLAANTPDVAEVLVDGESALLVAPDDPDAGATALTRLLSDPTLQARLSEGALAASRAYTWEARAKRLVAFFEAIV